MEIKASQIVAALSGVASYAVTSRGATVKMADGSKRTLTKAQLPPAPRRSFFTIADALAET